MRRAQTSSFLIVLSVLLPGLLAAPAWATSDGADSHGPAAKSPSAESSSASPGAGDAMSQGQAPAAGSSPWENPLWQNATSMMRLYVCDYARRPPSWCDKLQDRPVKQDLPPIQGPPLTENDSRWLDFIKHVNPANLSTEDVETVRRRAVERRDPQAMEILGYLYAEGVGVKQDYVESYRWYGLAYLAGEHRVKPNMDIVWQQVQRTDLEAARTLVNEFNALTNGEVPDSLMAPAKASRTAAGVPPPPGPAPSGAPAPGTPPPPGK